MLTFINKQLMNNLIIKSHNYLSFLQWIFMSKTPRFSDWTDQEYEIDGWEKNCKESINFLDTTWGIGVFQ